MNKALKTDEVDKIKEDPDDKKEENNVSLDESMNKYDSDEESYKKLDEEEDYKDEQEPEGNNINKYTLNDEEDLDIGSVISKIKDFDNNVFKYEHLAFQDNYIIDEIKSFNVTSVSFSSSTFMPKISLQLETGNFI